jgi:hypothetical protein
MKLSASAKSAFQPSRFTAALPLSAASMYSGVHRAALGVTLNPACSRSRLMSWKLASGLGMYGRVTPVGYHSSKLGFLTPDSAMSCLAFSTL